MSILSCISSSKSSAFKAEVIAAVVAAAAGMTFCGFAPTRFDTLTLLPTPPLAIKALKKRLFLFLLKYLTKASIVLKFFILSNSFANSFSNLKGFFDVFTNSLNKANLGSLGFFLKFLTKALWCFIFFKKFIIPVVPLPKSPNFFNAD